MCEIRFSLLITVYNGTKSSWLERCLISVNEQNMAPSEVVIVEDGPISKKLTKLIIEWAKVLPIIRIELPENLGAGGAAKAGFAHCSNPWIARLDADDIAIPTRFSRQLAYLKEHPEIDVLGAHIAEFSNSEDHLETIRTVPLEHQDIASLMPFRCPVNNSTVIFRKGIAQKVGGYEPYSTHEDYFLWVKMINHGAKFANMPDVLVKFRMELDTYRRRRGMVQVKQELKFQKKLLTYRYISLTRYFFNIILRVFPRVFPTFIIQIIYRIFFRSRF